MRRLLCPVLLVASIPCAAQTRRITRAEYLDRVYGGWLGKIAGLALGVPKEFAESWPPSGST